MWSAAVGPGLFLDQIVGTAKLRVEEGISEKRDEADRSNEIG
jgi:hypothetical protein